MLTSATVTRAWNQYWSESAQRADFGEENYPAGPTGDRTRDLSITSPALRHSAIPSCPIFFRKFFRRSVVWVTVVRLISSFTHRMHLLRRVDWVIFMREVLSGRVMFCDKFDGRDALVILKLQENIWSRSVSHFDFQNSLARWPTMTSLFMIVSRLQSWELYRLKAECHEKQNCRHDLLKIPSKTVSALSLTVCEFFLQYYFCVKFCIMLCILRYIHTKIKILRYTIY